MASNRIKILLIDDDENQHFLINRYLKKIVAIHGKNEGQLGFNFELDWVNTYQKAIKAIDSIDYNVILVDYSLGQVHGTQIIREAIENGCKTPFILQSYHEEHLIDVEAMEAGAVDYLVKEHVNPILLERSIRYAIRHKQKELELDELNQELEDALLFQTGLNDTLLQTTTKLNDAKKQMDEELEQARITQQSLLPSLKTKLPGVQLAAKYIPIDKIGGDLYDVIDFREDKLGFFIADVTGHGVSAALLSFLISGLFRTFAPGRQSPSLVSKDLNKSLGQKISDDKFVSSCYCIYDSHTQTLTYSSAGHPPGYIVRKQSSEIIPFDVNGHILGVFSEEEARYEDGIHPMHPGDKIFLYTDCLLETRNDQRKMFGKQGLEKLLLKNTHLSINDLLDTVHSTILAFSQDQILRDDLTLIGLEVLPEDQENVS